MGADISPTDSADDADSKLLRNIAVSIFRGYRYPYGLITTMHRKLTSPKIYTDAEKRKEITYVNILTGCLERNGETMSFERTDAPFLWGRLFALLEQIAWHADPKVAYKHNHFSAACTTPASTFAKLMQLKEHHIAKMAAPCGKSWEYRLRDLINQFTELPIRLSTSEQCVFILGYYKQREALFPKKETE
jgi:CRISPR-associated protein Csd1